MTKKSKKKSQCDVSGFAISPKEGPLAREAFSNYAKTLDLIIRADKRIARDAANPLHEKVAMVYALLARLDGRPPTSAVPR